MANYLFQVGGQGWPIGQWLIPADVIIDTTDANHPWRHAWKPIFDKGLPPPPTARALDQETYRIMCDHYGCQSVFYGPHVVPVGPTT
jgi:hypothetical protein